jgi:hypothetical protein
MKDLYRFAAAAIVVAACGARVVPEIPDGSAVDLGAAPVVDDPLLAGPRCSSGAIRDPNESEGPQMMPGRACNECHASANAASGEGDAPIFAAAGTLYPSGHEPDDCIGSGTESAVVVVTGADRVSREATANKVGNFFLEDVTLQMPIRARVIYKGRTREMKLPQTSGDCNHCHTSTGSEAAPGRIVLP